MPVLGYVLAGLLLVGFGCYLYWDLRLDLFGVQGLAWVEAATVSHGTNEYSYRHFCRISVLIPRDRLADPPDAATTAALLEDATSADLDSVREAPDVCRARRHTWQRVLYDPTRPALARLASEPGLVGTAFSWALLFALLLGVTAVVRRVKRRFARGR